MEKGASPTWRSATMGAFHDRVHQKFGVEFDTKQWLDDAMVNCAYRGEQTVYQKWIDTCDEAVNWFLDKLEVPRPVLNGSRKRNGVRSPASGSL